MNSREREVRVKREGDPNYTKITPSSRSQWSAHKNPRIVRVSRSFGGKDRHSKVYTVRGLRDRRIRLSVPTAVELYDLQDKLGLSQPSKVVDWLLDATKNDIDNLPPLPITQFYNPNLAPPPPPSAAAAAEPNPNPNPNPNPQSSLSQFLASNLGISPSKHGMMKMDNDEREKDKWINEQENINHQGFGGFVAQLSAQNLFPLGNVVNHHHHHHQSPFPNMPNYNPYFHWDHPNLSLSHFGGAYPMPNQAEDQSHNALSTVVPSTSHLYFCPTTPTMLPFPPYLAPSMENVQQNAGFSTALHLMSSSPMRPFVLNVNSKSLHPYQNDAGRLEKGE